MAVENWKAQNAFHFPSATTTARFIPPSFAGEKKTRQQSNGVPENLDTQMRP
jgi:hypothetical protein